MSDLNEIKKPDHNPDVPDCVLTDASKVEEYLIKELSVIKQDGRWLMDQVVAHNRAHRGLYQTVIEQIKKSEASETRMSVIETDVGKALRDIEDISHLLEDPDSFHHRWKLSHDQFKKDSKTSVLQSLLMSNTAIGILIALATIVYFTSTVLHKLGLIGD